MSKASVEIHLDLGCGTKKHGEYYTGIDINEYEGVDIVQDLRFSQLPFESESVDGVYTAHFLEHLTFEENLHLFNEVYRVLKQGKVFEIIVPHGMSYAGMVDLSHKTFWTEDTFGYFTPANVYNYDWQFNDDKGERNHIINKWKILSNDSTPPYEYSTRGWVEVKLREVHAYLEKLP